jgi:hypothetical protein
MNVYLAALRETDQVDILKEHASFSKSHTIISSPATADIILILRASAHEPQQLLQYPIYMSYPDRCVVYTEEDDYLPLLPTIHTNARESIDTHIGRVFNYAHISRNGRHRNPFVGEMTSTTPIGATAHKRYLFSFLGDRHRSSESVSSTSGLPATMC